MKMNDMNMSLYLWQLERYEETVPLTTSERKALRRWVCAGNSPYLCPGERYEKCSFQPSAKYERCDFIAWLRECSEDD